MESNKFQVGVLLDIGDIKPTNQDSVLYRVEKINKYEVGLFVIADGMGGLAYGEEISNLVVTYLNRWWDEKLYPSVNYRDFQPDQVNQMLEAAVVEINVQAVNFSKQVDKKAGSTLSLLLVIGKRYFIKNVGDSRIYVIRKNERVQLTQDQSLVAQLLRNGEINQEEARNHKQKNVLTMCLGVFDEVKIFSAQGKVNSGDIFLLCSDGFYNYVAESAIIPIINSKDYKDFNQKAQLLRNAIPEGNARDNVSIILAGISKDSNIINRVITLIIIIAVVCGLWFLSDIFNNGSYLNFIVDLVNSLWR